MKNRRSDSGSQTPDPDEYNINQQNEDVKAVAESENETAAAEVDLSSGQLNQAASDAPLSDSVSATDMGSDEILSSQKPDVIGQPISSQPQKKRLTRKQKLKVVLISVAGVLLLSGLALFLFYRSMLGQVTLVDARHETLPSEFDVPEESLVMPVPSEKGVINILLLGVDSTDPGNFDGRSDSMMILTVNEKQGSIKLTSLQRDMLVYLPGRDEPDKINAANVYGGPLLAVRVVNNMLRLDIENYVVVNMSGMREIIDIAGGVMIDVSEDEISFINRRTHPDPLTEPGLQLLDGNQAVRYARIRKLDSDFVRMERQRIVMQALLDAFMDADVVRKSQMISEGLGLITTNLRPGQIMDLGVKILPKMNTHIEQMQIPIEGHFIEDSRARWVIRADFNAMIPKLQSFIWGRTFDFDPVRDIPGAPGSSSPLPTSPPTPTPPAHTPAPEPSPEPTPQVTTEPSDHPQDPSDTDATESTTVTTEPSESDTETLSPSETQQDPSDTDATESTTVITEPSESDAETTTSGDATLAETEPKETTNQKETTQTSKPDSEANNDLN